MLQPHTAVLCWQGPPCHLPARQDLRTSICPIPQRNHSVSHDFWQMGQGQRWEHLAEPGHFAAAKPALGRQSVMGMSNWAALARIHLWQKNQKVAPALAPAEPWLGCQGGLREEGQLCHGPGTAELSDSVHSEKGHELSASQQKYMDLRQRS